MQRSHAAAAVVVKIADKCELQTEEVVSMNPLTTLTNGTKATFLVTLTFSSFASVAVFIWSLNDPGFFRNATLSIGQVACFVFVFSAGFAALGAIALSLYQMYTCNIDFHAAMSRYLPDDSRQQLFAAAELSIYLTLFFVCDRTDFVSRQKKHYDRDFFWFIWALLCLAGLATLQKAKPPKPGDLIKGDDGKDDAPEKHDADDFHVKHLQRDQTEEWKGWMQVMFLWYHYFEAKELYNAIRLYIAAYVWMTGFGNFSYYYMKKDFSLERFLAMQWRLNFLVFWICAMLQNEYMLYYICVLHTTFTVIIYAGLGIKHEWNHSSVGICGKFAAVTIFALVVWDVPGVFDVVWKPLTFLVGYHDPEKTTRPVLQEWQFRSHLDHLVWIFGMFCAYNHPRVDSWLVKLDALPRLQSWGIKLLVSMLTIVGLYLYVDKVFSLDKFAYNALHPYTSFIPIAGYCILRNIFKRVRMYHLHLFEFLGKVTLETYIAQFHIWMSTTGINGSPKKLLRFLPDNWPMVNFLLMSGICLYVSFRLFHVTNTLKQTVLPSKSSRAVLYRNLLWSAVGGLAVYTWASMLKTLASSYMN